MRGWLAWCAVAAALLVHGSGMRAQSGSPAQAVKGPDERMKADILVVVAHPDDEGGVTPYLARAIYDQHKRVGLVFMTRGGSGGNDYSREHGPALANLREQEARTACAKLGITNVWFLAGQDTASQNVLNSLANWGHGANLEALVRIVRLTRPEVIISWLPAVFVGENHGDHQAAGVLATEAFDLAGDPTAFPAQVAGASKRLEVYLENLTPWQPKKLYYFSDADDQKQFQGTGPAYSIREISQSQKKSYLRLALEAALPHLTQFPQAQEFQKMTEDQFKKFLDDPNHQFWAEPMTLTLGKSAVKTALTDDVFAGLDLPITESFARGEAAPAGKRAQSWLALGGPWLYYDAFRRAHGGSDAWRSADPPEIAVKAGSTLAIPLVIGHTGPASAEIAVTAPAGWKVATGQGRFELQAEDRTYLMVEITTPDLNKEQQEKLAPQEVVVKASLEGKALGELRLKVSLKASALPE
jgi:LmbE family N-acetylglucosaminyl deacetylase